MHVAIGKCVKRITLRKRKLETWLDDLQMSFNYKITRWDTDFDHIRGPDQTNHPNELKLCMHAAVGLIDYFDKWSRSKKMVAPLIGVPYTLAKALGMVKELRLIL